MKRPVHIQVIGGPGSGKSRLATKLVDSFDATYIELDAHFWKPNWEPSEEEDFKRRVTDLAKSAQNGWVIDGSYTGILGDTLHDQLDCLVYLQISPVVSLPRVIKRSFRRIIKREMLWGTNRESVKGAIELCKWVVKTHSARVKRIKELKDSKPGFEVLIFRSNRAANKWLGSL